MWLHLRLLYRELVRRRVLKTATAYAAAGWILVEVSATDLPLLQLPPWAPTLVLVLVLLVLLENQRRALGRIPTGDMRAYEQHLKGRQFLYQFRRKAFVFAREMFTRAVEIDPGFALAHAGLFGLAGRLERALECLEAALHAGFGNDEWLEHDPDLAPLREDPRFRQLVSRA